MTGPEGQRRQAGGAMAALQCGGLPGLQVKAFLYRARTAPPATQITITFIALFRRGGRNVSFRFTIPAF